MVKYVRLTPENIDLGVWIQNQIFPVEDGREELIAGANNEDTLRMTNIQYWIGYNEQDEPVGICGVTQYKDYPEDCFLGWYGVLANQRQKGYVKEMFQFCKEKAKELGYKTLRLYTDEIDNRIAVITYKKYGMTGEVYENKHDKTIFFGRTLTFSIALDNQPLIPWKSRMLYLQEEDDTEAKYRKK